MEHRTHIL